MSTALRHVRPHPARGAPTAQAGPAPLALSATLAGLMAAQAALGLTRPDLYRDADWVRATWAGNDAVTLALAVPLLVASALLARRGSARAGLLWLGALAYAVYNYAFYLFGAALGAFFPVHAAALVLAAAALGLALSRLPVADVAGRFRPRTPVRAVGGYLVVVAAGLTAVWLGVWAAYVFGGRPTPVEPEAFKLVAALDLTLMVPALAGGGALLWRRRPWGYVVATVAGVQGALYLLVLAVSGGVLVHRGLADWPGEVPLWGGLCVATAAATAVLFWNVRADRPGAGGGRFAPPGPIGPGVRDTHREPPGATPALS